MNSSLPRMFATLCLAAFLIPATSGAQAPDDPAVQAALEAIQAGDFDQAIQKLEPLADREDASSMGLGILGGLYVQRGDAAQGLGILRRVLDRGESHPALLFNAGRAAVQVGDIAAADEYLTRAVQMAPNSPASRELGLLRGRLGRTDEAYVLLRGWVAQNPDDLEARLAAALGAVDLRRVSQAEDLLAELPQTDPGVQLLWGRILLLKGDPWGAIGFLQPLVDEASGPLERDGRRLLADAYMTVGESDSAVKTLEGKVGGDPRAALILSRSLFRNGDVAKATEALAEFAARARDSEDTPEVLRGQITSQYGQLLMNAGKPGEALPFLEIATRFASTDKLAWQSFGQALAASGRRDEAQTAIARFRELTEEEERNPLNKAEKDLEDPTGRELREAMKMLAQGNGDEALARIEREIQLADGDPRPLVFMSRALLLLERKEEALQAAQAAAQIAPESPDVQYSIATAMMGTRRLDEAERMFRKLLSQVPDYTPAMSDLAVLLIGQDRGSEAKSLLQRVLELRPDDPVAKAGLERLSQQ